MLILKVKSLLPLTTKFGQGNIFRSVCQEFCPRGRGACMAEGVHGRGACLAGSVHGRYYEIWSMSGRYASYWNAFLLLPAARSCGQGNIFEPVCHSVHRGGGGLPQCMLGRRHPPKEVPPWKEAPPPGKEAPLRKGSTPRPVRILLECILVLDILWYFSELKCFSCVEMFKYTHKIDPAYKKTKYAKEATRCKGMIVVTVVFDHCHQWF